MATARYTSSNLVVLFVCYITCTTGVLTDRQSGNYLIKAAQQVKSARHTNYSTWEDGLQKRLINQGIVLDSYSPYTFRDDVSQMAADVLTSGVDSVLENTSYNVSSRCLNDTEILLQGLVAEQGWAFRMVDSIGKPPSNLMDFHITWLGSYDECIAVTAHSQQNPKATAFTGKYCKTSFPLQPPSDQIPQGVALTIGLCVPNSCSDQDVTALIQTGIYALPIKNYSIPAASTLCQLESLELDTKAIVTIVVCSMFAFLMVIATIYDIVLQYGTNTSSYTSLDSTPEKIGIERPAPGTIIKVLLSFSVYTNAQKILNTSQPAGALTAVNGIRFISMSWVILGHTYAFGITSAENISTFLPQMLNRFTIQAIANATVSVDTFFLLSGLLVGFLTLKQMKKMEGARHFPWGMFYFHRFWRLTPPYMLFLMLYVSTFKYWTNGPLWSQIGVEKDECRDSWWTNLLYINNWFPADNQCMAWSWYLANDMQFYILSPLMLIPLYYSSLIGGLVCLVFLLVCCISAGVISSVNDLSVNLFTGPVIAYFEDYYFKPYTRIGPYVIGLLTGFVLYKSDCRVRVPRLLNLLGWAVATGTALSVLYGTYDVNGNNEGAHMSTQVAALYNAVSRTAWGMAVAWVIFACATGNGGFVNTLLSWSPFVPLGRLTYCAYLAHPVVMYLYYFSRSHLIHFDDLQVIYMFLGHMVLSYMVAFVLSLAFESPMMGLEKVLLGKGKRS